MKQTKIITVILVILLSILTVSAGVISKEEITWSESPLSSFGIGDYIVTTTYDDGYAEGVYHRGAFRLGYIFYLSPKITISTSDASITIPITLEGQGCALSGTYSLHHVDLYKGTAGSSSNLLYGQDLGMITCGRTASYNINIPKSNMGSIATTPGSYEMAFKEVMWNQAGMIVTETRIFTLVVEGVSTPPPPPPNTGTISVTSNPSGATVRVSSTEKGYTPVSFPMLPGNYIVYTSLAGYKTDNYGMTVVAGNTVSHNANLQPVTTPTPTIPQPTYTTPQPTYTTPNPTQTTPTPTYSTPIPTYTTPNPTQTTPQPTSTVPLDCYSGYMWDSTYQTCRPWMDVLGSSVYIIVGIILIGGLYLLKRKDIKW